MQQLLEQISKLLRVHIYDLEQTQSEKKVFFAGIRGMQGEISSKSTLLL